MPLARAVVKAHNDRLESSGRLEGPIIVGFVEARGEEGGMVCDTVTCSGHLRGPNTHLGFIQARDMHMEWVSEGEGQGRMQGVGL